MFCNNLDRFINTLVDTTHAPASPQGENNGIEAPEDTPGKSVRNRSPCQVGSGNRRFPHAAAISPARSVETAMLPACGDGAGMSAV